MLPSPPAAPGDICQVNIMRGALQLMHRTVKDAMTPFSQVRVAVCKDKSRAVISRIIEW